MLPNFLAYGDIEDVVRLVELCNLLVLGTDNDKFSRNIEDIFEHAKLRLVNGKLERQIYSGKHMFSEEMRLRAYEFLAQSSLPTVGWVDGRVDNWLLVPATQRVTPPCRKHS